MSRYHFTYKNIIKIRIFLPPSHLGFPFLKTVVMYVAKNPTARRIFSPPPLMMIYACSTLHKGIPFLLSWEFTAYFCKPTTDERMRRKG